MGFRGLPSSRVAVNSFVRHGIADAVVAGAAGLVLTGLEEAKGERRTRGARVRRLRSCMMLKGRICVEYFEKLGRDLGM